MGVRYKDCNKCGWSNVYDTHYEICNRCLNKPENPLIQKAMLDGPVTEPVIEQDCFMCGEEFDPRELTEYALGFACDNCLHGKEGEVESETVLPTNAALRKGYPVATGVIDYFPDALLAIAEVSKVGNEQHNPGKPLHWDKTKSTDHADALVRHLIERGTFDTDGMRHSAKVAWRALALLQTEIEKFNYER